MVEVLRRGYRFPFSSPPPLSPVPIPLPSYSPSSIKGIAFRGEVAALLAKGEVEPAAPSPGIYSQLFVVWKTLGSWRPVIDLSCLNGFVQQTHFKMESNQSALNSIQRGDWMVSIDLKDANLQVPVYPDSRHFLRFVSDGVVYQFWAFCFGLSTAPQVSKVLEVATWRSNPVFASFYFRDISFSLDRCSSLGPFIL